MTYEQTLLAQAVEAFKHLEEQDWYDPELSSATDLREEIACHLAKLA